MSEEIDPHLASCGLAEGLEDSALSCGYECCPCAGAQLVGCSGSGPCFLWYPPDDRKVGTSRVEARVGGMKGFLKVHRVGGSD